MDDFGSAVSRVRLDGEGFARDVATMRGSLDPLVREADSASRAMQGAFDRFLKSGKVGFEDLRKLALSALADIAKGAITGAGGGGGLLSSLLGLPGRATGGPVTAGRPYVVGERGPELFVPTGDGRIAAPSAGRGTTVTINVNVPREASAPFMARTADQVARAVQRALARAEADG